MKADYSEFLTPAQLEHEEGLWATCGLYQKYADVAWKVIMASPIKTRSVGDGFKRLPYTILEIGCGTGWVPHELGRRGGRLFMLEYTGLDKNPECVARAQAKNPSQDFGCKDVRELPTEQDPRFDLVMSWAVLKHFALHEWDDVFRKVLSYGAQAAFTLPITEQGEAVDDGIEFPHVRIPLDRVKAIAASVDHTIIEMGQLEGEAEHWFITRRR